MAITDVNQSLVDIKSIGYVDNILGISDSDLKEWQFPSDNGAKEWRKVYTLTIPAKPTGVASITVKRTASQMSDVSAATWNAGASAQNVEVRYKDTLTASASAKDGYNSPSLTWTSKTVEGNVSLGCNGGSVKAFTLTKSSLPTGVSAHTVTRTSSPLAGAHTGALSNGATIYYGDVLTQSATAATGYNNPSVNWSSVTVTGNVTATVTAGSVAAQWRTIYSGSFTLTTSTFETITNYGVPNLKANVPTKLTGQLSITYTNYKEETNNYSAKENSKGLYSVSVSGTAYNSASAYLKMADGKVELWTSGDDYLEDGWWDEECGGFVGSSGYTFKNATAKITKIEQYY